MSEDRAAIAARYRRFAELEAHGVSDVYEEWALGVAGDEEVLDLVATLPGIKRQANLVFAAARFAGAPIADYGAFRAWLVPHWIEVAPVALARSTQTNEAGRCAVLLPVLSRLEGPLALIEAGASAGLCLHPDRYSYRYRVGGDIVARDPASGPSTVALPCAIDAGSVPDRLPEVASRAGVDLHPLRADDPETREWLRTLVWPEHDERRERLDAALALAARHPVDLVRCDLLDEIPRLVAAAPSGARVVVFHSAVLAYVDAAGRERFAELMRSLPDVVWISNEGVGVLPAVDERLGRPGDGRTVLAVGEEPVALVGPHGQSFEAI